MLQVKSFKISDDKGINELLLKYRLAPGGHILVSDGEVCIPYEDGLPPNKDQQIVAIGEQKNTMLQERAIIEHSQLVLDHLVADAKERVSVAEAKWKQATNNKELEKRYKEGKDAHIQLENQRLQNAAEIARLDFNLQQYDEQIAKLS